jgi:hypothetical protein
MDAGSRELTRRATAHAAALAFGVTYLATAAGGAGAGAALWRGSVAAFAALLLAPLLCRPVVDAVLDALARDEARRTGIAPARERA